MRIRVLLALIVLAVALGGAVMRHVNTNGSPLLSTIALGQPISPSAMVVDTKTSRAFIVTTAIGASSSGKNRPPSSRVTMIDTRTGTLLRTIDVGDGLPALAIDQSDGRVFVADSMGANSDMMRMLDSSTGALLRSVFFHTRPTAVAVDEQIGRVFVAEGGPSSCVNMICHSDPSGVGVFDARTLRLLRTVHIGSSPRHIVVDEPSAQVFVTTFAGVYVLDAASGRVLRILTEFTGVLAVDNRTHRVFMEDGQGTVYVLAARSGRILGKVRGSYLNVGGPSVAAAVDGASGEVAIMDNGLLTAGSIGMRPSTVHVVDGVTGRVLYTVPLKTPPSALAVDMRTRQVYVTSATDNSMQMLDTRQKKIVRAIAVGPDPISMVVDENARRVLVEAVATPTITRPDAWSWLPPAIRSWVPFLPHRRAAPLAPLLSAGSVSVVDMSR